MLLDFINNAFGTPQWQYLTFISIALMFIFQQIDSANMIKINKYNKYVRIYKLQFVMNQLIQSNSYNNQYFLYKNMGNKFNHIKQLLSFQYTVIDPEKASLIKKNKTPYSTIQFFKYMIKIHEPCSIVICIMLLVASSISSALLPKLIGRIVDLKNDESKLKKQIVIFLVIIIFNSLFILQKQYSVRILSEKIVRKLRLLTYNKFIGSDLEFFEKNGVGSLITRLSNDVGQARTFSTDMILALISNFILFISNCTLLFLISTNMTLVFLLVIPIYMYITIQFSKNAKRLGKKYNKILSESTNFIQQRFTNIITISAFKREQHQISSFQKYTDQAIINVKQAALYHSLYTASTTLLPKIGIILSIYIGSQQILKGNMTIGSMTTFLLIYEQLSVNALAIAKNIGKIMSGIGSLGKLFKLLSYKSKIQLNKGNLIPPNLEQFNIQLKDVSFSYPKTQNIIFTNLNVKFLTGSYIGIVGRSGSGKSSILKLLLRLYDPDEGEILLNGINIKQYKIQSYHNHIGYVSQQPMLYSGTILDNILYSKLNATQAEIQWAIKMAGINFISDLPKGIHTKVGQRGKKLSGGQKQRISIARALIRKPKVLIFDEATSALDAQSEFIVQKSIQQIVKKSKQQGLSMTVIVIAHKLSTIKNTERIIVFNGGQIAEEGTHQQLILKNGIYKDLIQNQIYKSQGVKKYEKQQLEVQEQQQQQLQQDEQLMEQ